MKIPRPIPSRVQSVFVIVLLFLSSGKSQSGPIDFENLGFGANWTWTVFENFPSNPTLSITANPNPSGINPSATVAKFNALESGQPWAGCETLHGAGPGYFSLNANNCVIRMMVYKSVISPVGIKFATPSGASTGEIKVSNTLINQWEELSFNFAGVLSAPSSIGIDQLIVFPDFKLNPGRTSSNICYFDNITFNAAGSTRTVTGTTTSLKGLTGNQQAETKLFPNPNNGEFSLQLSGTEEAEIRIFSVLGLRIKTIKAESMNTIDMHQFANGLYVLQVWEKDQLVYKTQLSKE